MSDSALDLRLDQGEPQLGATLEEPLEESRDRTRRRLSPAELRTGVILGGGFLLAATVVAALLPWQQPFSVGTAALLVLIYALVSRVEFETGSALAIPTHLVLVPMLFALPPPLVPLLVVAGLALGDLADVARGRKHVERLLLGPTFAWHSLGPAVVVSLLAGPEPAWHDWPVYVLALALQFVMDGIATTLDQRLALGVVPRLAALVVVWAWTIDLLLAPIALAATIGGGAVGGALLALPLSALLALLAHEREKSLGRALELASAYERANAEARRDVLTGVGNRLAWDEALQREDARRARVPGPAAVIVLDLDGLKQVNDLHGHHAGDELLRALAATVRESVRATDVVARIGGDEIGILLAGADAAGCAETVERLRSRIARHRGVRGIRLSAALGYAVCAAGEPIEDAVRTADARMYERKPRGRSAA